MKCVMCGAPFDPSGRRPDTVTCSRPCSNARGGRLGVIRTQRERLEAERVSWEGRRHGPQASASTNWIRHLTARLEKLDAEEATLRAR